MNIKLLDPANADSQYCWLIELGELRLGVDVHDGWCMRRHNGDIFYFDFPGSFVPLEPILEIEYETLFAFLQEAAALHVQFKERILDFPACSLIKHTLATAYSDYWPTRALSWLSADVKIIPLVKDELERFSNNKVMSQSSRQQAKRLLRVT